MIDNIETQQFKMMMQAIKERDEAVNERQRLIDSNRELVNVLHDLLTSHYLLSGGLVPTDIERQAEILIDKHTKQ